MPDLAAFLQALTASGSVAVLTNQHEIAGSGGMALPFCVLNTVITGAPWRWDFCPEGTKLGSPKDRALRRICLRLLARMSFLSAELALSRQGETHPFMALLHSSRGTCGGSIPMILLPFNEISWEHLVLYPTNQAALLQVTYLMGFIYRRFPWPRRQHLADVEHARTCHATHPSRRFNLFGNTAAAALAAPGLAEALLVELDLWHVLAAYSAGSEWSCDIQSCFRRRQRSSASLEMRPPLSVVERLLPESPDRRQADHRSEGSRLLSGWVCGGARWLLLDTCRQRHRRVLE